MNRLRPRLTKALAALVPLTLVALAVSRPGFAVEVVDLNDQSVWITNLAEMKVGRYNRPIEELTGALMATTARFDVLQQAQQVALSEVGAIRPVNPASVQAEEGSMPGPEVRFAMGGGVVLAVDSQGTAAWVRPFERVAALRIKVDAADLELGGGGAATVAPDGTVLAVTANGEVLQAGLAGDRVKVVTAGQLVPTPASLDGLTAVGLRPYVLSGTTLQWPDGAVDLGQYGQELVLQAPSEAANEVVVASATALLLVDQAGRVTQHKTGSNGRPAAPVRVGDCVHAAWATRGQNYLTYCTGPTPEHLTTMALSEVTAASLLVFRVNREVVVLNDVADGRLWLPDQDAAARRPNWSEATPALAQDAAHQPQPTEQDQPVDCTEEPAAPKANDDQFGIRPGATAVLMVLSNDTAGRCGALGISKLSQLDPAKATAQVVHQGRAIQLTVHPNAQGTFSFSYTVLDGHRQAVPSSAVVTVTIVPVGSNHPPRADQPGQVLMEQDSQATYQVLPNFADPDGDPLHLVAAATESGLTVGFQPNGQLVITGTGEAGLKTVAVTVSDGRETADGVVLVDLRPARSLSPRLEPAMAQGYAGRPVQVAAFDALRSWHTEAVVLQAVAPPADCQVDWDPATGVITLQAAVAKTYHLEVTVMAGEQLGRGVIRVDVAEPPSAAAVPLAVQDTVYLQGALPDQIDPLVNDLAPSGGVMMISAVAVPPALGVKVAVIDHQFLEIIPLSDGANPATASGPGGGSFSYTLAVDGQQVQGNVVVVRCPEGLNQPPVLAPINLTVKTGGVVTIPALERAVEPAGLALSLVPDFPTGLAPGQGQLFVGEKRLRYQAPPEPMTVQITYQVLSQSGQRASGLATVRVHQSQGAAKAKPEPVEVTGRVLAGQTSRIPIDLTGIDVDGDAVTLQGIDLAPQLGRVVEVGADYLVYQGFPGEQGTDEFTYAVEDWVGLRAVAPVRVAVAPKPEGSGGVVARDDQLTVRPGEKLQIRVLNNDLDMAGGALNLCGQPVGSDPAVVARYVERRLEVTAPSQPGPVQIEYTACNQVGGQDRAMVRLTVDPAAPFRAPQVKDVVVGPGATINQAAVDVDVMALVDNPSGPLSDLALTLPGASADLAQVKAPNTVTVTLQSEPAMVVFQVTNTRPEAGGVSAFGCITVPALGTFPPMLRPGEGDITVLAGQSVELGLAQYVMVGPGKTAILVAPDTISAAKTDGSKPYKDARTLVYTADRGYAGPASITFKVADAPHLEDPTTRVAVLTLPITVKPAGQVLPVLTAPLVELERAGPPRTIDLAGQVSVLGGPVPAEALAIKLTDQPGQGLTANLNGTVLALAATPQAQVGATQQISLMLSYEQGPAVPASVAVLVTAITRPLVSLVPVDQQVVDQSSSVTVEVLAGAWNPAPEAGGLTISEAKVFPAGAGTVSHDGQAITVTASGDYLGTMAVSFKVNDALGAADRVVSGSFKAVVRGQPEAPTAPRPGTPEDGQVSLTWDPPADNGAPILDYLVTYQGGSQTCHQAGCTITGLGNGQTYAFTVRARNAVGLSPASPPSGQVLVDLIPNAPTGLTAQPGQRSVQLTWSTPPGRGSAVTHYTVSITAGPTGQSQTVQGTSATFHDLAAGATYVFAVRAHNAHPQPSDAATIRAVPYDDPSQPSITVSRVDSTKFVAQLGPVQANGSRPSYSVHVSSKEVGEQVYCAAAAPSGNCTFPTKPGVIYAIWAEVVNQTGKPIKSETQTLTQYSKPVLTAVDLTWDGVAQDASHGIAQATWAGAASPGDLTYLITWDGTPEVAAKAGGRTYRDLKAGLHTLKVQVCHNGLIGVPNGAAERCSEPLTKSVELRTRPAVPRYTVTVLPQGDLADGLTYLVHLAAAVDSTGGWSGVELTYAINQGAFQPASQDTDLGAASSGLVQVRACPGGLVSDWCALTADEPFP